MKVELNKFQIVSILNETRGFDDKMIPYDISDQELLELVNSELSDAIDRVLLDLDFFRDQYSEDD